MPVTSGLHHLGLTVGDLEKSTRFFTEVLGWTESGHDPNYPRTAVSDGNLRITLWQVDRSTDVQPFDRRRNIGLHHVALTVATRDGLDALHERLRTTEGVRIEFAPEPLGGGPRVHMICREPGGTRIEFIWPG